MGVDNDFKDETSDVLELLNSSFGLMTMIVGVLFVLVFSFLSDQAIKYYPEYGYSLFIIPWIFCFVYNVYQVGNSYEINKLVVNGMIPLFLFLIPAFIHFDTWKNIELFKDCSMGCAMDKDSPLEMKGYEPYFLYASLIFLLGVQFLYKPKKING